MSAAWTMTKAFHKAPYPSISPQRPELSQAGKTVLVTGGTRGIGYSISRAFAVAGASKVIMLARRANVGAESVASLTEELKKENQGTGAEISALQVDVSNATSVAALWRRLAEEGIKVDVLVLNAAITAPSKPILELGTEHLWSSDYNMNVRGQLDMAERFYKQEHDKTKTKNAFAIALQHAAEDIPPEKMQVLLFHPGGHYTDTARSAGYPEDFMPWDDINLPGHFAVWAASPEASFLHGRFVWAAWDVDEMKSGDLRKRIDEEKAFLKVGVNGL
ncbi:NAD(P)-binding protein [Hypoxylon trugodes]|uniref:NAD(P)-binding protein n=1 Tax=Hypoxylon trugodes TaxID=326681 RepID=UPI0021919209|nr:NAD(P)-binding protein [Hypoxylon trugodes]KAI1386567.1 NAD(P)-binding protein [Hypoxylon trugodes]